MYHGLASHYHNSSALMQCDQTHHMRHPITIPAIRTNNKLECNLTHMHPRRLM
jgi:hypothetical protein